jgi:WD40 repeat protein
LGGTLWQVLALRVWPAQELKPRATLKGSMGPVYSVVFSPGGTRLATGHYLKVGLWDPATGKELGPFKRHTIASYTLRPGKPTTSRVN